MAGRIIDIHSHVGLSQDGGHGKLEVLLANMDTYGIEKTVVFATDEDGYKPTYETPNTKVITMAEEHPERLIPFARIVPSAGEIAVKEFERCYARGVKGLKLKPLDGFEVQQTTKILDIFSQRNDFPVIIHTAHDEGCQPTLWEPVFHAYPRINFVLAHGSKDLYKVCADVIKKYPNVFVDTTTLSFNRTRHIYETAGARKILFGSDYPYSHPAVELKKFEVLIRDQKDLEMILFKNAETILGMSK